MIDSFAAMELHVGIAAQEIFSIGGIGVTNSTITGAIGSAIVVFVLFYVARMVKLGKYNRFVGLVQWVFEGLLKSIDDIIPDKELARKVTPLAVTIFFVVIINYWLSIMPGLDSIRIGETPLFRGITADLNFTLALAIVAIVMVQVYAVKHLGFFCNVKRYFRNPIKDPIGAFEGLLEIVGEMSRGTALALRLFGNAFAGEVLLLVVIALAGYFAGIVLPLFMLFELFIGFIQAYVFFILMLIFTALAISGHGNDSHDHSSILDNKMIEGVEL